MTDLDALLTLYATPPRPAPPSPAAARVLEQAETGAFAFENTTVRTYAWGPADGPLCLMLHGWGSKAADLAAFVRPLTRKGWRVLALDAPAHGDSPGSDGAATASMLQFTRLLRTYGATLGGVDALLGHSIGAAACCYASAPESPLPGPPLRTGRLVLLGVPTNLAAMTRNFLNRQGIPDSERAAFRALIEGAYGIRIADVDISRLTHGLTQPVLLAHDRTDEAAAFADADALASGLPNATLLATEGLGHAGVLTAPRVLKAVTAFLDSHR